MGDWPSVAGILVLASVGIFENRAKDWRSAKRVIWIKARSDFDVLFQLLNNLRVDEHRCFWILYPVADEDICDIGNDLGQMATEVKIAFPVSHNTLTIVEEYVQ